VAIFWELLVDIGRRCGCGHRHGPADLWL